LYKIPANTLFLGKHIVFVPECHSTNTLALQLSQNPATTEGSVVITNHQTTGRGQRGNTWESAPGMNLTCSVILRPAFLALNNQFYLTIITSLAVRDYLAKETNQPVAIKWPNDILVHNKKICGILIENQVQGARFVGAVAGIGLNVNQTAFNTETATSQKLVTNVETSLETVLHKLLGCLEARYLQLRNQHYHTLKDDYLSHLYARGERRSFIGYDMLFSGTISSVDENGRLMVETENGVKYFGIKEISFAK
jgi:BirA family biotin operon repressor/biotin-[acetyl-CoA-carboxylase] ligase